jgi:hypothetical protein
MHRFSSSNLVSSLSPALALCPLSSLIRFRISFLVAHPPPAIAVSEGGSAPPPNLLWTLNILTVRGSIQISRYCNVLARDANWEDAINLTN